jgi:nitrate reductase gamma subunit
MNNIYQFITGPLTWTAILVLLLGMIFRMAMTFGKNMAKERHILTYLSWKYGLRSIVHWIIPFVAATWRRHPLLTLTTFLFHVSVLALPLFLCAHMVLIEQSWGLTWWTLPEVAAQLMGGVVLISCLFFLFRRILSQEIRYISTPRDYLLLLAVAMPFLTGFPAYYQWYGYTVWVMLHVCSGVVLMMIIPFSRLSHMMFFWFTRAYTGSEFGAVRYSKDW